MVAIVSLGTPGRSCCARGGVLLRYEIGPGDLLVMGGSCRRAWEHAGPKTARAVGPRISVQFRPGGSADSRTPGHATIRGPAVVWMAVGGES
jgi:hypothetical protein